MYQHKKTMQKREDQNPNWSQVFGHLYGIKKELEANFHLWKKKLITIVLLIKCIGILSIQMKQNVSIY